MTGLLEGLATAWLLIQVIGGVIALVAFVLVLLFFIIPAIRGSR